jgi:hypothetical protein
MSLSRTTMTGRHIRIVSAVGYMICEGATKAGATSRKSGLGTAERTDPFRSAVPIDPDQLFRLIPISRSD